MKTKKSNIVNPWINIIFIFFISLFILSGILLIIDNLIIEKNKNFVASYSYKPSIKYQVYYNENKFYNKSYYDENYQFVADLIKNIDIIFNYNFNISKPSNYEYDYKITGKLISTYNNSTIPVYIEEYDIFKNNGQITNSSNLLINEKQSFNYNNYNNIILDYKNTFNIGTNSYFQYTFEINVKSDDFNEQSIQTIIIPLNEKVFSITTDAVQDTNKTITSESNQKNYLKTIIGSILLLISIIAIIIKLIINSKNKSRYQKKLKRIFNEFDPIIVEIKQKINEDKKEIIEVKNFYDLVDIENDLHIPINFYEEIPNQKGEFTILNNYIIYKYILDSNKKDK